LICVLHPVGPLPASVYWRRRVLVFAAGLVVLLILWLLTTSGGAGPGNTGSGQAAGQASTGQTGTGPAGNATTTAAGDPTSAPPGPSDTLAATPPADDPGRPGGGSAGDPTTPTTPTTAATSTAAAAADTPGCTDDMLTLTVTPARPDYPVGALPEITLSVQNISHTTCTRDLAASQQEVLLYAGRNRLWSSNDCYPGGGQDVQALAPGERDRFSVTWSGLSSRPHCAGTRTHVGPGRYHLVGRIGTLRSKPAPLVLR
jgi:hypothetical protein